MPVEGEEPGEEEHGGAHLAPGADPPAPQAQGQGRLGGQHGRVVLVRARDEAARRAGAGVVLSGDKQKQDSDRPSCGSSRGAAGGGGIAGSRPWVTPCLPPQWPLCSCWISGNPSLFWACAPAGPLPGNPPTWCLVGSFWSGSWLNEVLARALQITDLSLPASSSVHPSASLDGRLPKPGGPCGYFSQPLGLAQGLAHSNPMLMG